MSASTTAIPVMSGESIPTAQSTGAKDAVQPDLKIAVNGVDSLEEEKKPELIAKLPPTYSPPWKSNPRQLANCLLFDQLYPQLLVLLHEFDFYVVDFHRRHVDSVECFRHGVILEFEVDTITRHVLRCVTRDSSPMWCKTHRPGTLFHL